jgi:hypothetical protein
MTAQEEKTFAYMAERNAVNFGYEASSFIPMKSLAELEEDVL